MEDRARQLQSRLSMDSSGYTGADRRYYPHSDPLFSHQNEPDLEHFHGRMPIQTLRLRYPSAPVPLEPWDREAILAYRDRVNANSVSTNHRNPADQQRSRRNFDSDLQRIPQNFDDVFSDLASNRHGNLRKFEKNQQRIERSSFHQGPDRFRDIQNSAISPGIHAREHLEWPGMGLKEQPLYERFGRNQSELTYNYQVRGNPNPNLVSSGGKNSSEARFLYNERIAFEGMNCKRFREDEPEDCEKNLMRRRLGYCEFGLENDSNSFPERLVERRQKHSDDQLSYPPERDIYLASPSAQSRVKLQKNLVQSRTLLQHNLIQTGREKKTIYSQGQSEKESFLSENCYGMAGLRDIVGSVRAENSSIQLTDNDDKLTSQRKYEFSKQELTQTLQPVSTNDMKVVALKNDHVFPEAIQGYSSAAATLGLKQLDKRAGNGQSKGRTLRTLVNSRSKKPKIRGEKKSPGWVQLSKQKGKLKNNHFHASTPWKPNSQLPLKDWQVSQNGLISSFLEQDFEVERPTYISEVSEWSKSQRIDSSQYERSTPNLSISFKHNGLVAQEVVNSLDKNMPDYTRTSSLSSKGLIRGHSLSGEEVEEPSVSDIEDSQVSLEKKGMTDSEKTGTWSKSRSMNLYQEKICTSEKESILKGCAVDHSCSLEELDTKTMLPSVMQSQGIVGGQRKFLSLDCKENGGPATADVNQLKDRPLTVESFLTCTSPTNVEKDLSDPSKLKSGGAQEIGLHAPFLTSSTCNPVDMADIGERPQKKLRVNQLEKPASMDSEKLEISHVTSSVLQPGIRATESQGPVGNDQVCATVTSKLDTAQQSAVIHQTQSSQTDKKSLQKPISASSLPQKRPPTFRPPTQFKLIAGAVRAARPRTWRRNDNSVGSSVEVRPAMILNDLTSVGQSLTKVDSSQSAAYIRKGNSLVRTSSSPMGLPVAVSGVSGPLGGGKVYPRKSSSIRNLSTKGDVNNVVSDQGSNVVSNGAVSATIFGGPAPPFERPRTPPLVQTDKFQSDITSSPQSSPAVATEVHLGTSGLSVLDAVKVNKGNIPGTLTNVIESQLTSIPPSSLSLVKSNLNDDRIENSGAAQMIYLKRKSNQLIAASASKSQGLIASINEGGQSPSSCSMQDIYYKRKKNQLVRSSVAMDTKIAKAVEVAGGACLPDTKEELKVPKLKTHRSMAFFQTKLGRVLKQKKHGILQSSWVWTLSGARLSSTSIPLLQSKRVVPSLFPWKRPSYGRTGRLGKIKAVPDVNKGSSLSLISKKLKRLRKRDTVYTKSVDGFSLHRSGVLSLGGSNLKWTKSIEKRSKQANEEATMAVAAAEKKKREEKEAVVEACTTTTKTKAARRAACKAARGIKLCARERIIHVGLFRYKMDPSKRTLQRIADEESTHGTDASTASGTIGSAKLFTPRRLSIGGDEYLRVGNGNQLVRDPKTVSRALASEKVRWSLHTARCRLAKKQQYCQFFTRFGKCDKEGGKCPYIHDREKVAVCTNFLKGTCSNVNCKLTHKVIPERMQDCSYFLQGFCTNENCPYRHVNVNPKARVCDGFLKGYCADGDKCNKKHTYVCPQYAATGDCPERLNCKLHHPKKKDKPKSSSGCKSSTKSIRRYFVAGSLGISESASALLSMHYSEQRGPEISSRLVECAEFISLDVSGEAAICNDTTEGAMDPGQRAESDFFSNLRLPAEDIDMLIKPVRLLQKGQVANSSIDKGI
eukprot:Gb_37874 [translate_table: standard]